MPKVISALGPTRAFSRPPIGATIRIIIVIGSERTPACCGENPWTFWKYSVR